MITMSCRIHGGDFESAGLATQGLKAQLARIGVGAATMRRAMIAAYEAEMNVVIHARTGTLWARVDEDKLDLEVADEGPGIPDVTLALREGWSTASQEAREMGFGAGMGLPNIRRSSDLFDIETRLGRGTRIRSTIFLSSDARSAGDEPVPRPGSLDAARVDPRRCRKCLRCIFACPTGALRVHSHGPELRPGLCIGCTECFAACGSHVFGIPASASAVTPEGAALVLPQGLVGRDVHDTLAAIAGRGFSEVRFTEEWMQALRGEASRFAPSRDALPVIPPLCPAVVALVESRFPSLMPHLGPWMSPLEAAGEEFPLRPVVLVAPCPAQYASALRESLTDRLTVWEPSRLREELRRAPRNAALPSLCALRPDTGTTSGELTVTGTRYVLRALARAEAGALGDVAVLSLFLCECPAPGTNAGIDRRVLSIESRC